MDHGFISSDAPAAAYAASASFVPPTVRSAFEPCTDLAAAEHYTRQLAHTHYENFSVVSVLLPRHLRQDFCNVYAFCRTADDLADEVADRSKASEFLPRFREHTGSCYRGMVSTPIVVEVEGTIRRHKN